MSTFSLYSLNVSVNGHRQGSVFQQEAPESKALFLRKGLPPNSIYDLRSIKWDFSPSKYTAYLRRCRVHHPRLIHWFRIIPPSIPLPQL